MAKLPKPDGFETYAEAKRRCAYKVRLLSRGGKREQRLAARLGRCSKADPCASGACDICLGHARLQLYRESQAILASRPDWTRASIIGNGFLKTPGQLTSVNLNAINKTINKRLERSSLSSRILFAGIDISLNLEDNIIVGWQPHIYALIEGKNTRQLQEAIKAAFPPEPTAAMPYDFDQVTDPSARITYLFKGIFKRRSHYTTSSGHARTRFQPLKWDEQRELLLFLDQYPIHARLILRGVRRNGRRFIIISKE
jgi:hypothetical protein